MFPIVHYIVGCVGEFLVSTKVYAIARNSKNPALALKKNAQCGWRKSKAVLP
jgi:hypothetical protein